MDTESTIRLDQFMKWIGWVRSGGEAKHLIQDGQVQLNGEVETRRSKQLRAGDKVSFAGREAVVGPLSQQGLRSE